MPIEECRDAVAELWLRRWGDVRPLLSFIFDRNHLPGRRLIWAIAMMLANEKTLGPDASAELKEKANSFRFTLVKRSRHGKKNQGKDQDPETEIRDIKFGELIHRGVQSGIKQESVRAQIIQDYARLNEAEGETISDSTLKNAYTKFRRRAAAAKKKGKQTPV